MKTTLDLPRPLLQRLTSQAAKKRVPISRYIAESLEKVTPMDRPPAQKLPADSLFQSLREELGL